MTLCTERIRTLDDIRAFLGGNEAADITPHDREAAYAFIERALVRFRYHLGLSRAGKGRVREFLAKVTGYSDSQLSRLIAQQRRTGRIRDHRLRPPARPFATVYTTADAVLLAEVDEAFGQPSGPAIKRILWRQYHVFGDERFERLARISNGHIYNLRGRRAYRSARTTFRATRGAISSIGKRRRPRPEGRPGFVRVDTVHSGDRGRREGGLRDQHGRRSDAVPATCVRSPDHRALHGPVPRSQFRAGASRPCLPGCAGQRKKASPKTIPFRIRGGEGGGRGRVETGSLAEASAYLIGKEWRAVTADFLAAVLSSFQFVPRTAGSTTLHAPWVRLFHFPVAASTMTGIKPPSTSKMTHPAPTDVVSWHVTS